MRVSVVIPLYNKAAYIRRALDSVFAQSFTDFEILVVDDGSTDGGGDLVRACGDPRTRLVVQPNQGPGVARQRGMEEARGEFIAFLDADDEWAPRFLERAVRLLEDFPEAGAGGLAFREHGKPEPAASGAVFRGVVDDYFAACLPRSVLWSSSTIVRRRVLEELRPETTRSRLGEELLLWCQIALKYPIAFDGTVSAYYHTEAAGRSTATLHLETEEPAFIPLLRETLRRKETGGSRPLSIRRYMAKHQLFAVRRHLKAGNRRNARRLLRKVRPVSGYRSKWIRYWIRALLPRPGRAAAGEGVAPR